MHTYMYRDRVSGKSITVKAWDRDEAFNKAKRKVSKGSNLCFTGARYENKKD